MPASHVRRISHSDAEIMVPVDIQGQYIILSVSVTSDMLAGQETANIAAGSNGNVDVTVPSDELWQINITNHEGSGADITLNNLQVSPNGGTTFYTLKTSHLDGQSVWITAGNILRASFHNAGAAAEKAVLNYFGRKLKV